MPDTLDPDFGEMAQWLRDRSHAEPGATFPLDAARVSTPGLYAWHADEEATRALSATLGSPLHPLYVDQAGGNSMRTGRASGTTLKSAIGRTHLRGSTQSSSFRRSLAAVLWKELDLRCDRPKRLDHEGNARLTAWMLEHLAVAALPFADRSSLGWVTQEVAQRLDPQFNLVGLYSSPARRALRRRRRRYFSLATADDERIRRIVDMERLVALDPEGGDFLRRRLAQELEKLQSEWAS